MPAAHSPANRITSFTPTKSAAGTRDDSLASWAAGASSWPRCLSSSSPGAFDSAVPRRRAAGSALDGIAKRHFFRRLNRGECSIEAKVVPDLQYASDEQWHVDESRM